MTAKFDDIPAGTVLVGLTTKVIGGRYKGGDPSWWQRTDYCWACGVCPPMSAAMYKSMATAKRSAVKHAAEHRDCSVQEV